MSFADLGLIEPLLRALRDEQYERPTPIQEQAIPEVLAGRDLLGLAQTGTGKTAAFALPILQRLVETGVQPVGDRPIRVLVLTPTRELAAQIGESFGAYGRHLGYRHTVIFGGVGQNPQERALRAGVDVLVATPGRLLDLVGQRIVHLQRLEVFVLDEADRMLDMGFIHDVRRVIALLPTRRQTLFFSATMPPEAQALADALLRDPATVAVTPVSSTVEKIEQSVYFVEKEDKRALLAHLLRDPAITRALVFTRTKHGANRVAESLARGPTPVRAEAIHGNKSQNARERALGNFKRGDTRVLVATDIAARGIDIDQISHVVNFDLPNVPETYVHRIGRTARAGASGAALSFCDREERAYLRDIERLIRREVPVVAEHAYRSSLSPPAPTDLDRRPRPSSPPPAPAPARTHGPSHPSRPHTPHGEHPVPPRAGRRRRRWGPRR
jgi:ATP-dependent RNA helicase RhlE